jgi:hypothetical protein
MPIASSVFSALFCTRFKISGIILRSLIYFELILVQGDKHGSSFSFLQTKIQFSQQHLLKRLSFFFFFFLSFIYSHVYTLFGSFLPLAPLTLSLPSPLLQLCQKLGGHSCVDAYLGVFLSSTSSYLFLCQYHSVFTAMTL